MGPNEQIKLAALTAAAALQAAREALDAAVATAAAEVEIKLLMASMSTSKAESILAMDRAAGSLCCVAASCATAPLKEKGARVRVVLLSNAKEQVLNLGMAACRRATRQATES